MPAPATYEYSSDTLVAAHTAVLDEIDAGTGAGKVKLYDESDTLLATITLDDPAGTVNGTTGALTLAPDGSTTGSGDGTCSYGTITDSDDNVILSLPAEAGASAVSGKLVINTLAILTGATITLNSAVIGA